MSDRGFLLDSAAILARLAAGEVVLMATDTLPGLHARLDRPAALEALGALKGRADEKPFLVLAASMEQAMRLARPLSSATEAFLAACWPGPFTAILPAGKGLPRRVTGRGEPGGGSGAAGTVAVRVPAWPELRGLLQVSGPLVSSSANQAAEQAPGDLPAAMERFRDLATWRALPESSVNKPSALVDLTGSRPRLVRAGPLPLPPWSG